MSDYVIGAHILESLTTGMYQDSRMIFREYVQNSCDAIDAAVKSGILAKGEGRIDIRIDQKARMIVIEDNGTGIKSADFVKVLGNVADSDKRQGDSRGFRGIGRLGGMAYCETLTFTAKFKGEGVVSRLVCNAKVLRELLHENDSGIERYTASEILAMIDEFMTEETNDIDAHYFRVELERINKESDELVTFEEIRKYLSFNAPVPYHIAFIPFSSEIRNHAKEIGQKIDEYDIYLNKEQLFKDYTRTFATSMGADDVFDLKFADFRDDDERLIAWGWIGLSSFKGMIDTDCPMLGIRLRKGNIQIGGKSSLLKFFKEERGVRYFIGEIFCESDELIPNSQRDYFIENRECKKFEAKMYGYCIELATIYKYGSDINSAKRKECQAEDKAADLSYRLRKGLFADDESREQAEKGLAQATENAEKERAKIARRSSHSDTIRKIAEHIEHNISNSRGGGG